MLSHSYKNIAKKVNLNKLVLIFCIAFLAGLLGVFHVIIGYAKTPAGFTYLATGHYYLDYFLYLQTIAQGIAGRWSPLNYLTSFDNTIYLRSYPYIILGQIARIFHFSPMFAYWLAVFVLTVVFIILMYLSIRRILAGNPFYLTVLALVLAIFSGPFYKMQPIIGGYNFIAYDFWTGPSIFVRRFGTVPYHLLSSILVLLVLLSTASFLTEIQKISYKNIFKKALIVSLVIIFVLTFSPFNVITLLISVYLTVGACFLLNLVRSKADKKSLKYLAYLLGISLLVIPVGFLLRKSYADMGLFQQISSLETQWQEVNMSFSFILFNLGPILFFLPFGLFEYFKKQNPFKLIFLIYFLTSYGLFISPVAKYLGTHNLRFLSSINYIFLGGLGILGIKNIARLPRELEKIITILIILLVLIYSTIFNIYTVLQRFSDFNLHTSISYLPNGIIKELEALGKQKEKKAVLTGPYEYIGLLVPVFSHKRVYIGRTNETPDLEKKQAIAYRFYQGNMEQNEAKDFIARNNIGFVVLTSLDNFDWRNVGGYRFLKQMFSDQYIIIWKVI